MGDGDEVLGGFEAVGHAGVRRGRLCWCSRRWAWREVVVQPTEDPREVPAHRSGEDNRADAGAVAFRHLDCALAPYRHYATGGATASAREPAPRGVGAAVCDGGELRHEHSAYA